MFRGALAQTSRKPAGTFMTAASPGIIATTMVNEYYDSYEAYVFALADELRTEYEIVVSAGFVLQLDAPDLGLERARMFKHRGEAEFLQAMDLNIEAINRATQGPAARRRSGCIAAGATGRGRTSHDVPLATLLPLLYRAKVGALSIEFANPRHQHEYAAMRKHPLPPDVILIPGVIDSTTNFVEHPEVVANRICEAVATIGRSQPGDCRQRLRLRHRRPEPKPSPPTWCGRSSRRAGTAPISRPGGCGADLADAFRSRRYRCDSRPGSRSA
jgi:5-methyltetrahydropteroyltriglutamate--homocysteine methyltransferase